MIVDFHTHSFPDKLAGRALDGLSFAAGNMKYHYDGTVKGLSDYFAQNGVDYGVVLNIATTPKHQHSVNDFAIQSNKDNIIAFGSIYPDAPDAIDELHRLKEQGIKGIKLHPDYQNFFVDDKRMVPIYKEISKLGLITVFHSGVDIGLSPPTGCTPERLKNALPYFEGSPVVAAHLGGYMLWEDVMEHLCGSEIYLDTSFSYARCPKKYAEYILQHHSRDRVMLGSDMPWSSTVDEISFVKSLNIDDEYKQMILGENAVKLLNL